MHGSIEKSSTKFNQPQLNTIQTIDTIIENKT